MYLLKYGRYHKYGPEHSLFTGAQGLIGTDTVLQRETRQGSVRFEYFQLPNQLAAISTNITNISKMERSLDVAFGMCTVCGVYQDSDLKLTDYLAIVYVC